MFIEYFICLVNLYLRPIIILHYYIAVMIRNTVSNTMSLVLIDLIYVNIVIWCHELGLMNICSF
jgi:hypothetical protein